MNAGSGVNVISPVAAFTLYVPSPDTVLEVLVHSGATSVPSQSRTDVGSRVAPAPGVSLAIGSFTCGAPCAPELVSATAPGGAATVGV